ncbi:hypothetical protein GC163_10885 [bacterium]|nr:hypothetical protein [bacterium]
MKRADDNFGEHKTAGVLTKKNSIRDTSARADKRKRNDQLRAAMLICKSLGSSSASSTSISKQQVLPTAAAP